MAAKKERKKDMNGNMALCDPNIFEKNIKCEYIITNNKVLRCSCSHYLPNN